MRITVDELGAYDSLKSMNDVERRMWCPLGLVPGVQNVEVDKALWRYGYVLMKYLEAGRLWYRAGPQFINQKGVPFVSLYCTNGKASSAVSDCSIRLWFPLSRVWYLTYD